MHVDASLIDPSMPRRAQFSDLLTPSTLIEITPP